MLAQTKDPACHQVADRLLRVRDPRSELMDGEILRRARAVNGSPKCIFRWTLRQGHGVVDGADEILDLGLELGEQRANSVDATLHRGAIDRARARRRRGACGLVSAVAFRR